MALIINEERFIDESVAILDERIQSPITRFIEQTPTFVSYYHINVNETTTDEGFMDVESIVGKKSPIRYQKIDKFPIYGLEQVIAQLQDTEVGIDVAYEGEAIILPNTIKPLPNDYFIIDYVGKTTLFRVTEINYDNIRPDNFYKIMFKLDAIDSDKANSLNEQVHEKYTCILENIGSENQCIIQEDFKDQLDKINAMYSDMVNLYLSIFYDERYNALLGEMPGGYRLYDPYMASFINHHKLFSKKTSLQTIFLEEDHILDNKKQLKYERSIYRFFERRDISLIKPFFYTTFKGMTKPESAFCRWGDETVKVVDLLSAYEDENTFRIFPDVTIDTIKLNGPTQSKYLELIKRYLRNENTVSIYDIDLSLNDELINLDANLEMFFITPILLFIIKEAVTEFNKTGIADKPKSKDNEVNDNGIL